MPPAGPLARAALAAWLLSAAAPTACREAPSPPREVEVPGLEISGMVYLPDLSRYLVVSDDTPKKRPEVYLLDTAFRREKTLVVGGLEKMDDMESVALGPGGALYLLSSQSRTKSGKLPESRKLLVKVRRRGESLDLEGKVHLLDALEAAAGADSNAAWARFFRRGLAEGSVDIEGMAPREGDLLLGFKNPLLDGRAVILRLAKVDSLLAGRALRPGEVSLWRTLDLGTPAGGSGISDLLFVDADLLLLSPGPDADHPAANSGRLWRLRAGTDAPERVQEIQGGKPEGLVLGGGRLRVALDRGSDHPSLIRTLTSP